MFIVFAKSKACSITNNVSFRLWFGSMVFSHLSGIHVHASGNGALGLLLRVVQLCYHAFFERALLHSVLLEQNTCVVQRFAVRWMIMGGLSNNKHELPYHMGDRVIWMTMGGVSNNKHTLPYRYQAYNACPHRFLCCYYIMCTLMRADMCTVYIPYDPTASSILRSPCARVGASKVTCVRSCAPVLVCRGGVF